jgi:lipopolysaccharide export system protein LptA
MKTAVSFSFVLLAAAAPALAQTAIYRCGNTYTNDAQVARAQGCKLMEGGNVTVVEGTKVNTAATVKVATAPAAAQQPQPGQKVESAEQKARDADARLILEAELKKAEARQVELQKEWNNGEPEKMGPEHRNHQKYLDRVAELKAAMTRNESDIAGIRRELGRLPGASAAVAK